MHLTQRSIILYSFTEVNPDKGTETLLYFSYKDLTSSKFTEVNPDKGTETKIYLMFVISVEILVYRS